MYNTSTNKETSQKRKGNRPRCKKENTEVKKTQDLNLDLTIELHMYAYVQYTQTKNRRESERERGHVVRNKEVKK